MSNPSMEDGLCNTQAMLLATVLSLNGIIHDNTTIMNFRHLLYRHDLELKIFTEVND